MITLKFKLSENIKEWLSIFLSILIFLLLPLGLSWAYSSEQDTTWGALKTGVLIDLGALYLISVVVIAARISDKKK